MIQMLCTLRLVCAATEPIAEQSVSVDRGRWSGAEVRDDTDDDGVELGVGDVLALRPQHSSSHVAISQVRPLGARALSREGEGEGFAHNVKEVLPEAACAAAHNVNLLRGLRRTAPQ